MSVMFWWGPPLEPGERGLPPLLPQRVVAEQVGTRPHCVAMGERDISWIEQKVETSLLTSMNPV